MNPEYKITCPICLNTIEDTKFSALIPCGHIIHSQCLSDMIQIVYFNNTLKCPVCRHQVERQNQIFPEIQMTETAEEISQTISKLTNQLNIYKEKFENSQKRNFELDNRVKSLQVEISSNGLLIMDLRKKYEASKNELKSYQLVDRYINSNDEELNITDIHTSKLLIKSLRNELRSARQKVNRLEVYKKISLQRQPEVKQPENREMILRDNEPGPSSRVKKKTYKRSKHICNNVSKRKHKIWNFYSENSNDSENESDREPYFDSDLRSDSEHRSDSDHNDGSVRKRFRRNIHDFIDHD